METDKIFMQNQVWDLKDKVARTQNSVLTASSATIIGPAIDTGSIVRVMFTADVSGLNVNIPLALEYNGTNYNVKVAKNGALVDFCAHEVSSGVYKYLQAYTTIEFFYNGGYFVIIGNPIVLSSTDYTIYADGLIEQWGNIYVSGAYVIQNLKIPYTNTDYIITVSSTKPDYVLFVQDKTISSFKTGISSSNSGYVDWYAKGY